MLSKPKEYFATMTNAYAAHYGHNTDEWTRDIQMRCVPSLIQGLLKLPASIRALDVGCGRGDDVDYFASIYSYVVGIDICWQSEWQHVLSRRNNVRFECSDLMSLRSGPPFDLILDNGCFHHQHPDVYDAYLAAVARRMHSESSFVLLTFKDSSPHQHIDPQGRLHRYFDTKELHVLMTRLGLSVINEVDLYRIAKGDYYRLTFCRLHSCSESATSRNPR